MQTHERTQANLGKTRIVSFLPAFILAAYEPEPLWRILKDKWLRPADNMSTDSLLYTTDRALVAVGSELYINFAHVA